MGCFHDDVIKRHVSGLRYEVYTPEGNPLVKGIIC